MRINEIFSTRPEFRNGNRAERVIITGIDGDMITYEYVDMPGEAFQNNRNAFRALFA